MYYKKITKIINTLFLNNGVYMSFLYFDNIFCFQQHRTIKKQYMFYQETKYVKLILNICIPK